MNILRKNLVANIVGTGITTLMSFAFIPLYIKYMGVEAYGLVGFYISLQALFTIFDLGLSQTLLRELARLSCSSNQEHLLGDTVKTIELIYWSIACVLTIVVLLSSGFIATHWLNPHTLSSESVRISLYAMSIAIGLRWPINLYTGGLNGLQKQFALNVVTVAFSVIQGGGAALVLALVSPTAEAFFIWQTISAIGQILVMRLILSKCLPADKGRFSTAVIKEVWKFSAGMTSISLISIVLTQMDKLVLSNFLSLENFGYYMFASTTASVVLRVITPVFNTYLPKFTQLVHEKNIFSLEATYRQAHQLATAIAVTVSSITCFYSQSILTLWTRNPLLVTHTQEMVALFAIGNMLNGIVSIPYALQLAYGWTSLAVYQNIVATAFMAPTLFFFIKLWDANGAIYAWIALNAGYIVFSMPIMYKKILGSEKKIWFVNMFVSTIVGFVVAYTGTYFFQGTANIYKQISLLSVITLSTISSIFTATFYFNRHHKNWIS